MPVNVSWEQATSFCKKLSLLPEEKKAGREYRLPTEAEWEYACRATSTTAYCFGESREELENYAWVDEAGFGRPHPVGEKKANRWGLFDMHGNVSEWCQDLHGDLAGYEVTDPKGYGSGWGRVYRGGNYEFGADHSRSASRAGEKESIDIHFIGFRAAMSRPAKQSESEASSK